ncbi:MAG: alkaline phosphatase family protein [Deltaproteobacteria bacterium]|nr:alkaline phosphatase family protein [Deltaproteobacteria bacterium]
MPGRVAIIGVDCLAPQLALDRYRDAMPVLNGLAALGWGGRLRSSDPPITVPAWTCMATSQDPGQLGIYGFRNRVDHGYAEMAVADAAWVRAPTLWQLLSRRRRRSVVLGVPLTHPVRPLVGELVAGIPVPAASDALTWPATLRAELDAWSRPPPYRVDVEGFRTRDADALLRDLQRLRDDRFRIARELARRSAWDLLFMVDMSVDRLHHVFWAHAHPDHPLHDPGSRRHGVLRDFYADLDRQIGLLVDELGPDTAVLVVSDHGARSMRGALRLNEWLIARGYLTLRQRPDQTRRLQPGDIDFPRTLAWADGGYYARVFFNLRGREPQGAADGAAALRDELRREIESMPGPDGAPLRNRVLVPEEIYRRCENVPPDLLVYPADLDFRASAMVLGAAEIDAASSPLFGIENDLGVDGANHDPWGVLVYRPASGGGGAAVAPPAAGDGASIYDVAPTVLRLLGEPVPAHMIGTPLPWAAA